MELNHYYVTWNPLPSFASELQARYDRLILSSFLCQFTKSFVMHMYCGDEWKEVRSHLRTLYPLYSCSKTSDKAWWRSTPSCVVDITIPKKGHKYYAEWWQKFEKYQQEVPLLRNVA